MNNYFLVWIIWSSNNNHIINIKGKVEDKVDLLLEFINKKHLHQPAPSQLHEYIIHNNKHNKANEIECQINASYNIHQYCLLSENSNTQYIQLRMNLNQMQ